MPNFYQSFKERLSVIIVTDEDKIKKKFVPCRFGIVLGTHSNINNLKLVI